MQLASINSIYVFQIFSTLSSINTSHVKAPWYDDSRSNQRSIYAPSGFSSHPRCPADGNLGASWLEGRQVAQATLHLFDACRELKVDEVLFVLRCV